MDKHHLDPTTTAPAATDAKAHLAGPFVPGRWARLYLAAEFALLFIGVPLGLFVFRHAFGRFVIPTLVLLGLGCGGVLLLDRQFDRTRFWNTMGWKHGLKHTLRVWLPGVGLLTLLIAVMQPDLLLRFPREAPWLWLFILLTYPILSAYPQEVIFRAFLFHRYRALFPGRQSKVVVSGLVFGLAHLFFANWIAPLLTTLGGLLFARTYARTESVLQAGLEHSLWGDFIFTIGLGWYFYGGAIGG